MKEIRCFLALKLDIETIRMLSDLQVELQNRMIAGKTDVKWIPPPNIHVTMRFLGQISDPMVNAIKEMLRPVVAERAIFDLTAENVGVFPEAGDPKVIWAGLRDADGRISELHTVISERLLEVGFPALTKPFIPHITLGRVRSGSAAPIADIIQARPLELGVSVARNLFCYRSDLTTAGAEYHSMWRLPLAQPKPNVVAELFQRSPASENGEFIYGDPTD